jgi:hypothetical protein
VCVRRGPGSDRMRCAAARSPHCTKGKCDRRGRWVQERHSGSLSPVWPPVHTCDLPCVRNAAVLGLCLPGGAGRGGAVCGSQRMLQGGGHVVRRTCTRVCRRFPHVAGGGGRGSPPLVFGGDMHRDGSARRTLRCAVLYNLQPLVGRSIMHATTSGMLTRFAVEGSVMRPWLEPCTT